MGNGTQTEAAVVPKAPAWRWFNTWICIGVSVAIFAIALSLPSKDDILSLWIITMALIVLLMMIIGQGLTGKFTGILIDETNHVSLSRFQLVLWSVIILSALLAKYLANQILKLPDPMGIGVPEQLWGVLGISTVSLVGTPLIKSSKASQPDPDEAIVTKLNLVSKDINPDGVLVVNNSKEQAKPSDIFKGEEIGNFQTVDIGKLQMFFFTLLISASYISSLYFGFKSLPTLPAINPLLPPPGISDLPSLSSGMIALLGISHAGYLANKAVPHS